MASEKEGRMMRYTEKIYIDKQGSGERPYLVIHQSPRGFRTILGHYKTSESAQAGHDRHSREMGFVDFRDV
jgi:hypothetical protein